MKPLAILYMDGTTYYPGEMRERVASVRIFELEKKHEALSIVIPWFVQQDTRILPVDIKNYIENYLESQISTIPVAFTDEEKNQKQLIQDILVDGQEVDAADEADIDHIFEALINHAVFYVSVDEHILSKAKPLFAHFKLQVMKPSQSLPIVEDYLLKERANFADLFKKHP